MGTIPKDEVEFWKGVKNFERNEWRTNPSLVSRTLIVLVDRLTTFIKARYASAACVISVAYEATGHEKDSQHHEGKAVDLCFRGVPLLDQYFFAERFPFTGIGIYPFWNHPGLHLDVRQLALGYGARWWRTQAGEYKSLDRSAVLVMQELGIV